MPGLLSETCTKSQLPGRNMETLPWTGPESTKSCWSRMEDWEGRMSWTVGGALDGWTASSSCSPGFVGLQFHKEVLITKNLCVCHTDWNALICADCSTVITRHPALKQMTRKMQMWTLKNWLINVMFKVILDIAYDLSSWTLHMTCSLAHYIWLVFLDIIWLVILDIIWLVILDIMYDLLSWTLYDLLSWTLYDLSSWTLCTTCHPGHYIWLVILDII